MKFFFKSLLLLGGIAGSLPCYAAGAPALLGIDSLLPRFAISAEAGLLLDQQLRLRRIRASDTAALPVASEYELKGGRVEMQLLAELEQGASYLLEWREGKELRTSVYRAPSRVAMAAARFVSRYPQSDTIPQNLLYVQFRFDAPMWPDAEVWRLFHVSADTPGAVEISYAWRQRCFWLDSGRVLQLMIHPGRVKSGIAYGGPLLFDGFRYRIRIDSGLRDAHGNVLPPIPEQEFVVHRADHRIPRLTSYFREPGTGREDALTLRFSEPMDYSGLLTGIRVLSDKGETLAFRIEPSVDARRCRVVAQNEWDDGELVLELDAEIRDLGANTLRRPFEVHTLRETRMDKIPLRYRIPIR